MRGGIVCRLTCMRKRVNKGLRTMNRLSNARDLMRYNLLNQLIIKVCSSLESLNVTHSLISRSTPLSLIKQDISRRINL